MGSPSENPAHATVTAKVNNGMVRFMFMSASFFGGGWLQGLPISK
jgi:hypothetical protein